MCGFLVITFVLLEPSFDKNMHLGIVSQIGLQQSGVDAKIGFLIDHVNPSFGIVGDVTCVLLWFTVDKNNGGYGYVSASQDPNMYPNQGYVGPGYGNMYSANYWVYIYTAT